ncbi:MAG: hypothetical protein NC924_07610 [Candidatus Omnitrophica bacterium]|nr:hypothetical protein [Candidatus Omnitrophota bacterium]
MVIYFRHLYFISRALRYGAGHGQIQQGLGFVLAIVELGFGFRDHDVDAPGHQLGFAHGIADAFDDDIPVLGGFPEVSDQGPVKDRCRDAQFIASEFLF